MTQNRISMLGRKLTLGAVNDIARARELQAFTRKLHFIPKRCRSSITDHTNVELDNMHLTPWVQWPLSALRTMNSDKAYTQPQPFCNPAPAIFCEELFPTSRHERTPDIEETAKLVRSED
ncbi:hypothetical protein NPIL_442151 [Nephila pilipes]|uniref:Uncharacterized protein n=1 Tax=Nephila pilipes TaxID=299642 RepID=A0A8X6QHV1_NEPPI|nr:hypothetical protein NPIL_442151 [Nephila pilipes]